ncbi:histone H1 [Chryseobacterium sp. 22543]|uniref:histone H1 n=1 Tax=Chryseobacterium sp. 22543 TaxID=3453940 RepID=UPI003F850EDE
MKELIGKINAEFEAFKTDSTAQAENGNKAAGMRARKASLSLEKLMKDFRKVSMEEAKTK